MEKKDFFSGPYHRCEQKLDFLRRKLFEFGDNPVGKASLHLGHDILTGGKIASHDEERRVIPASRSGIDIAGNAIGKRRADPGKEGANPARALQTQMARCLVSHIAELRDRCGNAVACLQGNATDKLLFAAQNIGDGRGRYIGAFGDIHDCRLLSRQNRHLVLKRLSRLGFVLPVVKWHGTYDVQARHFGTPTVLEETTLVLLCTEP